MIDGGHKNGGITLTHYTRLTIVDRQTTRARAIPRTAGAIVVKSPAPRLAVSNRSPQTGAADPGIARVALLTRTPSALRLSDMKLPFVASRELSAKPGGVMRRLHREGAMVITDHGQPRALLLRGSLHRQRPWDYECLPRERPLGFCDRSLPLPDGIF
jgi:hypothetical protein